MRDDMHDDPRWQPAKHWPGAFLDTSGDEPTLVGWERADQVSDRQVIAEGKRRRYRVQGMAVWGLIILQIEVPMLAGAAVAGVASGWFTETFAAQLLGFTLAPSFTAWLLILRWAFRHGAQRDL